MVVQESDGRVQRLAAALPDAVVVTEKAAIEKYRTDFVADGSAGQPLAVVRAESVAQIQTAMAWAAQFGVPVVPRGAGTGLSGGATAVTGGLTISTERMTAIEIDVASQIALVEPGALNIDVKRAAAEFDLWYPPDPASFETCTIGGNLATNAGGLCCVKYGVTSDYVLGLQVVLADATVVDLGGNRLKDVAGLDLIKLFVGSEGTLGIIGGATLRLVPPQPAAATLVASFSTLTEASQAVVAIRAKLRPSMLELMDNVSINAVEDWRAHGLDRSMGALLLAQTDSPGALGATELDQLRQCCSQAGAADVFTTIDESEADQFVAARRHAVTALESRGAIMLEDVGAPVPLLPELVAGIADIAARRQVDIAVVAHAGDGNTHPIIRYAPGDRREFARAHAAFDEVMTLAIDLGGTITGEHGVGRFKRDALPRQLGADVMELNRRIKAALDPAGLLNPGAIF